MAEIKNTFDQGVMNKDLDERLVPNGQYRHAMNIQISTSEGSDVGTVQNILGNSLIPGVSVDTGIYVVGAVADEKNNCFYWFVKGHVYGNEEVGSNKDAIYKYQNGVVTPVFIDVYEVTAEYANHDDSANEIMIPDSQSTNLCRGMIAQYIDVYGQMCYWNDNPIVSISRNHLNTGLTAITLQNDINLGTLSPQETKDNLFKFVKKSSTLTCPGGVNTISKALDFQFNNIITGINIIEDLLFWTDNNSEPKQINIKTSISNTDSSGLNSTMLNDDQPMEERHVTVIKKAPLLAPGLEMSNNLRSGTTSGITNVDFDGLIVGNWIDINVIKTEGVFNWVIDDEIILKSYETNPHLTPLTEFEVKLRLNTVIQNLVGSSDGVFNFEIISIDNRVPIGLDIDTGLAPFFVVDLYQPQEKLFEFKFPRFALRYEYPDKQYSSIGPFSNIAFMPGNFDFHPRKGYNIAMSNIMSSLFIKEFVSKDIPKDVIGIDILYKESNSSNIYILDSIKQNDTNELLNPYNGTFYNSWTYPGDNIHSVLTGKYKVKAESIYATLPTNQTIRPWDNVPRKALAQEVTGNRIVYGNYLQNYNLTTTHPRFNISLKEFNSNGAGVKIPRKSLKSLRNYQVGIVYFDKYGRQTPVLTSGSASISIPKIYAGNSNQLNIKTETPPPDFATHYKFYVKETSNEYYNLAMDRWYDADDGNIWIAFPSSDRNKVDEDTFLILKKGNDSNKLVKETARYKVLAVENNAPDYIRLKKLPQGLEYHNNGSNDVFGQDAGKFPLQSRNYFSINYEPFINSSLDNIYKALEGTTDELWVRFEQSGNTKSTKNYRVSNISATTDADGVTPGTMIDFKIADTFESDVNFIYDEDNSQIENATAIIFEKRKLENSPKFDGRFFVKINRDEIVKSNIDKKIDDSTNYRVLASRKIYYMSPDHMALHSDGKVNKVDWHEHGLTWENTGMNTDTNVNYNEFDNWQYLKSFFYKFTGFFRGEGHHDITARRAHNTTPTTTSFEDVWFIDEFKSRCGGQFNVDNDTSGTWSSESHIWGIGSDANTGFETVGIGVKNYSNVSRIELGFSGLEPDPDELDPDRDGGAVGKQSYWNDTWTNNSTYGPYDYWYGDGLRLGWSEGNPSIYNVGEGQINSRYAGENTFVNALTPGTKIRWAEDPNGTIYTITSVNDIYKLRYDYDIDRASWGSGGLRSNARRPENFSRNWRLWLDKKMTWDPTAPNDGQIAMNGFSPNTDPNAEFNLDGSSNSGPDVKSGITKAQGYTLEIIEPIADDEDLPDNPAIWETEPKDSVDINLYHEASDAYPITLTTSNIHNYIKPGMNVEIASYIPTGGSGQSSLGNDRGISGGGGSQKTYVNKIFDNGVIQLISESGVWVDMFLQVSNPDNSGYPDVLFFSDDEITIAFKVAEDHLETGNININFDFHNTTAVELPWFNCYSFGNGVESNRIKDAFNGIIIDKGPKVSTTLEGNLYKEERRGSGLIFSGIYNSTSGTNDLNQFIQGEKITKDLNPTYGTVQKLFSRNTDLITFCEDKVVKILANKDAVYNADGNPQLTANINVLGQTIPFVGDYGISKNPESFSKESYRAYFTDKQRGAVLRLSKDGLTPISEAGMKTWFFDNLKNTKYLIGCYDARKQEYNLTLKYNELNRYGDYHNHTLSYKESEKGWVSFKSFIPENGISVANEFFTFKKGNAYKHHDKSVDRNTFYLNDGGGFTPSEIKVLFNQEPQTIKSFSALNYEGSTGQTLDSYAKQNFKNRITTQGWYVNDISTNEDQLGTALNFTEKQDEWFSPIKGATSGNTGTINTENFSVQGLGVLSSFFVTGSPIGTVLNPFTPSDYPVVTTTPNYQANFSNLRYDIADPSTPYTDAPSYFDFDIAIPGQSNLIGNNVPYTNTWDQNINLTSDGQVVGNFTFYWYDADLNAITHTHTITKSFDAVLGCYDANGTSSNHNSLVTVQDGSCLFDLTNLYTPPVLIVQKQWLQTLNLGGYYYNEYNFYITNGTTSAYGALINEPYVYEMEYAVDSGTTDSAIAADWNVGGWTNDPNTTTVPSIRHDNTLNPTPPYLTVPVNDLFHDPYEPNFASPVTNSETSAYIPTYTTHLTLPPNNWDSPFITGYQSLLDAPWTQVGVDKYYGFRLKTTDALGRVEYSNEVTIQMS